jgi:hypothetical protein
MKDGEIGVVRANDTTLDTTIVQTAPVNDVLLSPDPYPHFTIKECIGKYSNPHRVVHIPLFHNPPYPLLTPLTLYNPSTRRATGSDSQGVELWGQNEREKSSIRCVYICVCMCIYILLFVVSRYT